MKSVEWTGPAQADLARIDDHYAAIDPDFAGRVGRVAIEAAKFLAEWPDVGTPIGKIRRMWLVKSTPYLLLYRVYADRLRILRVRHARQNWRPQS